MLQSVAPLRTLFISAFVLLAGLLSGQVRAHGPIAINGNAAEWMAGFGTSGCPALVGFDGDQFFSTSFGCTTSNAPGAEQIWSDNANDQRTDHWNGTGNLDLRQFRITMDRDNIYFLLRFADITSCAAQNIQVAIASSAIASSNAALPDGMETNTSINWFRVVEASTSATGYWTDGATFTSAGSSFCSTSNDLWEIAISRSAMNMVNLSGTFSFSVAVACNTAGVPCEAPGSDVMDTMTTTGPNTIDEVGDGTLNFYTNPTLRDILCASYSYPYTMTSTAQSELVDAIQCANANGLSADVINLNGLTVSLIAATPFANYSGQTGLPQITSNVSIRNGTIFHDMSGGGFLFRTFSIASGGTLNLQNLLLSGASAPTPGGAFHNSGTLNVTNSTMHGYDTSNRGGVLYNASGASASFANALFYDNNAVFAHVMDNVGTVTIVNSTFDKHVSVGGFGAILEGTGYTVRNSILWNPGSGPTQISTGNTVSDSIVKGGYSGGTNILNTSPLFVDEGGNDFRIQLTSPAVNVGVNTYVPADTTDVDGDSNTTEVRPDLDLNPRVVAGTVDMGAYERQDALPPDPCAAYVFPYTLAGADNTARVANLRQAIQCANANASADTIDLNGQSVTMADSFADYSGATSLPQITSNISLQNGTLTRSGASLFRIISVSAAGSLTLRGTTISNGGGAGYASLGAGIHNLGTTTAVNTNIVSNTGNQAVAIYSNNTLRVVNSTIAANFASSYSAILEMSGTATIANTVISGNRSTTSDNISINSGTLTVSNSTVAYNYTAVSANNASGAFYKFPSATLIVQNSIIWGNRNSNNSSDQIEVSSGSPTVSNSIVEGGIFGSINADPLFVTPIAVLSTPTTAGDFQLNNFSPAIDAGANANVPVDTFDVDGDTNTAEEAVDRALVARRYNDSGVTDTGTGVAPIVDIGAYERQTNSDPCAAISFPYTLTGNTPVELRQAINCANANGTADLINLNGQTITLTDSFANYSGNTGLPQITTNITVRNGTITRSGANEFRFFNVSNTGNLTVRDLTLTNGGGVAYPNNGGTIISVGTASTLTVVNTTISGSRTDDLFNGSAIYSNATFTIVNSSVVGGGFGRGAIASGNGPVLIQNTLVAGNSGPATINGAGGVYFGNVSSATIENSTIVGNYNDSTLATQPGGVFASGGTINLTIRNSIIWGNRNIGNTAPQVVNVTAGTNTVTNSIIEGGTFGALNSDPLFLAPITASATPTTAGNFRLGDLSPAVDAGANANVPVDTFDVDGDTNTAEEAPDRALAARRYNDTGVTDTGSGTAPIVDLGAYEKQTNSAPSVPAVSISLPAPGSVSEDGAGNLIYTVSRNPSLPTATTVNITTAGTATSGGDYIGGVATVVIPANASTATITLDPSVDSIVESNETVILTIAAGSGYTVGAPASATGTILNDDSAALTIANVSVSESGTFTFSVVLNASTSAAFSVDWTLAQGTTVAADYVGGVLPTGGTLNFVGTAGETRTFTVPVLDDALVESSETFTVGLTNFATAGGFTVNVSDTATGTILDNEVVDFTVTTTPTSITVVDSSSNGDTLAATEPVLNNLRLDAPGRSFSVNGGALISGNSGDLALAGITSLTVTAAGGVSVASGAIFNIGGGTFNATAPVMLAGGTLKSTGTATVNPAIVLTANSDVAATGGVMTLAGAISGDFTLRTFSAGTFRFASTSSSFARLQLASGTATLAGNNTLPPQIDIFNSASLNLNGFSQSIDFYASSGTTQNTGAAATLTMGVAGSSSSFGSPNYAGPISGPINLIIAAGAGQTLSSNSSSFAGTTDVLGTLTVTGDSALGAVGSGNGTTVAATGALDFRNVLYADNEAITVNGGTLRTSSGTSVFPGTIALQISAAAFVVSDPASSLTLDGVVSGSQGFLKSGTGTLVLTQANTFVGPLTVGAGGLVITGSTAAASAVTINNGSLSGTGTIGGPLSVSNVGNLSPGLSASTGILHTANVALASGSNFLVNINGSTASTQYDQLDVNGTIDLTGADLFLVGSFVPAVGQSFVLIDNDGSDPVTGTFTGLPSNGTLTFNSVVLAIRYDGGDGNDVVLTAVPVVSIDVSPASVTEDGVANLVYTVTRSASLPTTTVVNITTAGSATSGSDYMGAVATATIAASATNTTITIDPTVDGTLEANETVILNVVAGSGYAVGAPSSATGTINNDDTAAIIVTPSSGLVTTEAGGTATFTVVLGSQPTGDVTIGLSISDTTEGTVAPTSLVFTSGNWNVAQTVMVTGVDDVIVDGNIAYSIVTAPASSSDSNYNGVNPTDVSVSNTDNDTAGITISPTAGLVTTEAGGTATFTVVLNSQPSADVSIGLSSSDTTEGTVAPTSLTFTNGNWNVAQTVTVTGVDDVIVDGAVAYSVVTAPATSADSNYNGVNAANVSVSNADNDTAGITVSPAAGLVTTEAGGTATFTIVLNSQPSADVSIGLSSSDTTEGSVAPTSLTFTNGNWNVAQTVTVTGVDDVIVDGAIAYNIVTTAATSSDSNYGGVNASDVSVSNSDNDAAGITVSPTAGLVTTEAGGTATFTVVLNSQPSADVGIGLSSSDTTEGTVAPTSLLFTSGNWNVAQTVTVTGVDDVIVDGSVAYSIVTAAATSADSNYNGVNPANVSVSNSDNDAAGIAVSPTAGLITTEAGGTATFTVALNSQPSADVSVGLSSSDTTEGTVAPTSLLFTSSNWNVAQTVTVTGVDDLIVDGAIAYNIVTAAATSADSNYNGVNPANVSVSNTDNDTAGITVTPTAGLITTEAGGTATFTVVLNSQPSADVAIGLASSDTTEGTVAPTSLTFTNGNWNVAQTVTVTGVDDVIVDGTVAYSIITAPATSADNNYNGVNPANVSVSNTDNDNAGITVAPTAGLITTEAGGTATFTVVLNSQPSADVAIGLASSDTTEGTVAPTSLTFTNGNWNVAQTVTVTGVDDVIVDGTVAYSIITAPATSADSNYNGVNPANVSVSNTDNDNAGITVAPTAGLITTEAGGTATFTVVLNSQPSADVSIGLSSSDTTEGTVAPTSLTFTNGNWNVAQTVTITGVDDLIVDGNVAYTINTAAATSSDSNYSGFNASDVGISNSDNDTAGITVAPIAGLVTTEAGGTATFTVVLNSQPSADVSIGLSSSDTTEGTVAPISLTFNNGNWNAAQTVTITGVDDLIVDGNVAYNIITAAATSSDRNYNGVNPANVSVSNSDNDTAGITVSPTAGLVTTEAGGTATFTVVLNSQPSADVTIGLGSSDTTEGSVAPTSLLFTAGNWNVAQTVTVTGVDDLIVDGNVAYSIVTAAATSSDANYNGVNAANVGVSTTDNDNAGITVSPAAGLVTTEAGGTAVFTVVLSSQPSADVSIGLSSSDTTEGTVAPTSLLFTAGNWNTAQTVTVTGVDDVIVDGSIAYTIVTAAASSADSNYNGVNPNDVSVSNSDNDNAAIIVVQSGGTTAVTEGGTTDSYTVALSSQPSGDVTIALTSNQVTTSPTSLIFTTANWATAQTVTVTAIDDAIDEATPHAGSVTSVVSSGDGNYDGSSVAPIGVSIADNDTSGITVTPTSGLTTTEAGGTANFSVVLNSEPTGNVTIGLTSSDTTEGTVAPTSLTFTSANWNIAQSATITGVDDVLVDGAIAYSIVTAAATSSDSNYNGLNASDVSVSNSDNDNSGVTVTESGGSTAATEGGTTDTYSIVLTSQPTSDVAVILGVGAQVSLLPSNLAFTAANWNVAQTVTVTATDDAVVEGAHNAAITHSTSSSDPNYSGIAVAGINVEITDNDSAAVGFALANVSQPEATSPMVLTVSLSNPVASGVTLNVNSAFGIALTTDFTPITGGTVSFPASSTTPQSVQVVINNDALDEDDETFSVTLSNLVATGDVTLGTATVNATILDDDATPTLSISSPSQAEGNAGTSLMTFSVNLSAVSGRDVSFNRATVDGSATAGDNDYVAIASGGLTIPAGSTSLTIPVTINGDTTFEGNETFSINLSGITNATPATLSGIGTIEEDDQQPTTTTITADTPDPTVVGQPYTVSVNVAAQTLSPTGTVTISDGSASCGPVTLTAATSPNSTASCAITSTTVGTKTLIASYTAATTAFGDSVSVGAPHQVNAASTAISVVGPTRSRINQPTAFTFALSVNAPGAGTPTGTVTLSSGAASCTATLPATSCNLTFSALGSRTVSASYAGDANFGGSTSSGAGNAQTLVYALSDLAVTKSDGVGTYVPGELLVYSVIVRNLGPDTAVGIRIVDIIPAGLIDVVWSCDASGGVACPVAGGSGNLDVTIASFPVSGLLNFTFYGNVAGNPAQIANTATVTVPIDTTVEDPVSGNNSATDTDLLDGLFANGFESAAVNAAAGSFRLPGSPLRSAVNEVAVVAYRLDDANGEALRVYARVIAGEAHYALATRNLQGQLRLSAWQRHGGDPTLSWSARQVGDGWVLQTAELR